MLFPWGMNLNLIDDYDEDSISISTKKTFTDTVELSQPCDTILTCTTCIYFTILMHILNPAKNNNTTLDNITINPVKKLL